MEVPEGVLLYDGFDDALIGIGRRCGQPDIAVYSYEACVRVLIERDGMSHEKAVEWMEFNVVGGWCGPETPVIMGRLEESPCTP